MADNIDRTLGRILATQEHIIKQLEQYDTKLDKHIEEDMSMERRLDKLEHAKSYVLGAVAIIAFIVPYASNILLTKMGLK